MIGLQIPIWAEFPNLPFALMPMLKIFASALGEVKAVEPALQACVALDMDFVLPT